MQFTKTSISILLVTLAMQATTVQTAFAFLGIPGTPKIPGDPLDEARKIERWHKCTQIRDDASKHQSEIRQKLGAVQEHLITVNKYIQDNNLTKQKLAEAQAQITQYENLLNHFKDVNTGLILNAGDMKSALLQLQSRSGDPAFLSTLNQLETQDKNPSLQQFARFIKGLLKNNEQDLQALLSGTQSRSLLEQLSILINSSEILIIQQKTTVANLISGCESTATNLSEAQAQVTSSINQLNAAYNQQEERKACNF